MKDSSELSQLQIKKLHELFDQLGKGQDPQDVLIDNASFQLRFRIGRRTAYNWRRKNLLKFVLIESKVFYRLSDIREFLENQSGWSKDRSQSHKP